MNIVWVSEHAVDTPADAPPGVSYQFERLGYFCADKDSAPGHPVFNRAVALRDTWAKIEKKSK